MAALKLSSKLAAASATVSAAKLARNPAHKSHRAAISSPALEGAEETTTAAEDDDMNETPRNVDEEDEDAEAAAATAVVAR